MVNYTEAVQQKRSIRFTYDGLERVVIPTAHGLHATTGKEMIGDIRPMVGRTPRGRQHRGDSSP